MITTKQVIWKREYSMLCICCVVSFIIDRALKINWMGGEIVEDGPEVV